MWQSKRRFFTSEFSRRAYENRHATVRDTPVHNAAKMVEDAKAKYMRELCKWHDAHERIGGNRKDDTVHGKLRSHKIRAVCNTARILIDPPIDVQANPERAGLYFEDAAKGSIKPFEAVDDNDDDDEEEEEIDDKTRTDDDNEDEGAEATKTRKRRRTDQPATEAAAKHAVVEEFQKQMKKFEAELRAELNTHNERTEALEADHKTFKDGLNKIQEIIQTML